MAERRSTPHPCRRRPSRVRSCLRRCSRTSSWRSTARACRSSASRTPSRAKVPSISARCAGGSRIRGRPLSCDLQHRLSRRVPSSHTGQIAVQLSGDFTSVGTVQSVTVEGIRALNVQASTTTLTMVCAGRSDGRARAHRNQRQRGSDDRRLRVVVRSARRWGPVEMGRVRREPHPGLSVGRARGAWTDR